MMNRPPFSIEQGVLLEQPESEIWARTGDNVKTIADQIFTALAESSLPFVDVASIGAGALNQAVKGMATARQKFLALGLDIHAIPFYSVVIDDRGGEKTRMVFRLEVVDLP